MNNDDNFEDDGVKDMQGTYIPANKAQSSDVQLPPDSVMRSAFLTAIKYRSVKGALTAYKHALEEASNVHYAEAQLEEARLEKERTIRKLRDAEKIHEADKLERDANLNKAKAEAFRAEQYLKEQEHEAEIAEFYRETERRNMQAQKDELMNMAGKAEKGWSKSEEELWDRFSESVEPFRIDAVANQFKKDHNLTPEQEEIIDKIVEDYKKGNS